MEYKISIIIPIHNTKKYLEQTLKSLIKQTIGIKNLEVIMINDCSTDGTDKIIDKYAMKYENFIAIHLTENSGLPGKPRNIGIKRATGDYLMFMDHDDYYSDDACEVFYDKITTGNADILFSRYNYIYEGWRIQHSPNHFGEVNEINIDTIDEDKRLLNTAPSIWTKIFRRKFIIENNIRFPEGILAEDLSFVTHSFLKARGIIYLNNYFSYNYRILDSDGEKSTIHIRNKKYLMAMVRGYYNTYNILKSLNREEYFPIIFRGHLQYWMNSFTLSDAKHSEKIELLEEIAFFYDKLEEYKIKPDKNYLPLFNNIISRKFDDAILLSDVIGDFKKREMKLYSDYQKIHKNQENLQKQLESNKNQIAELQTVKGYLNYKIRNIYHRIKVKFKPISNLQKINQRTLPKN